MPDTPQRIATDTSQKLSIRFGETMKAYQASPDLDIKDLNYLCLNDELCSIAYAYKMLNAIGNVIGDVLSPHCSDFANHNKIGKG